MTSCASCETIIGSHYVAFLRRVRRLEFTDKNGKPHTSEIVLSSGAAPAWSNKDCWENMADAMVMTLGLAYCGGEIADYDIFCFI